MRSTRNAAWEASAESNVVLEAHCASDLSVVNAARVSFNQQVDEVTDREVGLISYLMKNHHGTPFEHGYFRFRVKTPIFVAREWFRHRVGHSYNEWSGRYSEMRSEFFIPEEFREQVGKPGAYRFTALEGVGSAPADIMSEVCDVAARAYDELLSLGVAKEQARVILPVGTYTQFIWSSNPRSLMHFLTLRTSEHAMKEIRDCALQVEESFKDLMPVTHQAWVDAGRVAP